MPGNNNSNSEQQTKLITLDNLSTYTGYIEEKNIQVTRAQYDDLPSTKLTDGKSYYITDEGIIIKNGVTYGGATGTDTTYSLSAGTGDDANKIILTPSSGTPDKVTVPYATNAGTVNSHTVASDVPANAVFTDNNTTYGLSVGTGTDANKIVLTPSTGTADKITVPYASDAGTVNGKTVAVNVPADAKFTDTTYTDATTSASGLMSSTDKTKLDGIASGAEVNVQADWNETSSSSDAYIQNKPPFGTAALRNIPTSGDASNSEVVLGTDSRLSDARPASDVSSWAKASTKPTYTASEVGAIASTAKGANNGVAELDSTGKVPSSQLPSYVDDVLEYNSLSDFPLTGESGKIYIAKDTNKTYRWSGTTYTEISESLALGETSSTAFRGDHGKTAYDHATDANKLTTAQSSRLYKIATTTEGHIASVTAVAKSDITALGIPGEDTNTTYALSVGTGDDANKVILTPSSGTANKITVPYATKAGDADTVKGNTVPVDFEGTTDEWNQLTTEQKKSYDRAIFTDDYDEFVYQDADVIAYDNTNSGLSAENVQDAIDELNSDIPTITDTYSGTSSNGMSGKAVKSAIDALDVTGVSNINAGKTIKSWSETDGKVNVTTQDISITKSQVSDFPTLGTASAKDVPTTGNASATQVVMGNDSRLTDARNAADVSAWAKASSKPTYTASEVGAIASTLKGANNGVAELDSTGKVPSSQLPSYVDDVLEYNNKSSFPSTGESGKIYIAKDTNKTYRWSGSAYVEISESLALGETSSTAYRGDRGKTAYDHSQLTSGNPHNVSKSDVGLGNVTNDKQVKGLSSGTTENHVVAFGADGYTVKDSGYTIGKSVPSDAVFTDTTYSAASESGISLNSSTKEFSNSGVRAITTGNGQGTIRVNTDGTRRDVGIAGVFFGTDKDTIPTTWFYPVTNDTAHIEVTTSTTPNFYNSDKLILFLYDRYVNNTDEEPDYNLELTFDGGTTWYPVYQMVNSNYVPVIFDRAQNIKMESGRAYTLTYVNTLEGEIFLIDDFKTGPNTFIGTSSQWSSQTTKAIYDVALITND